MPITKIKRIRQPGVFRDFTWPADLPDFAKYNLIYGWNGSGKTTISRLLRDLEARRPPDQGSATIDIDGIDLRSVDFSTSSLVIKVFNNDFVESNVHRSDGDNIPSIFVLGETSVQQQQELETKENRLHEVEELLIQKREGLRSTNRYLSRHLSETAKTIKDDLSSNSYTQYNHYDRRNYATRADLMIESNNASDYLLSDTDRRTKKDQFLSPRLDNIDEVRLPNLELDTHNANITNLLNQSVVSNVIQTLEEDEELSTWIRDGLLIHTDRSTDICLFCTQRLPDGRLQMLQSHYNDAFNELITEIDAVYDNLNEVQENLQDVQFPDSIRFYSNLTEDYADAKPALESAIADTIEQIDAAMNEIQSKKQNMFTSLARQSETIAFDSQFLTALNDVIERHNSISDAHVEETDRSAKSLEANWVANNLETYVNANSAVRTVRVEIETLAQEHRELVADIPRLRSGLIDDRRPADEFNVELTTYLGHDELQLQPEDTGYAIVRHGQRAVNISEGEKTAIALLYFLKSLQNVDHEIHETVVVLDDPVSSLDSNSLYAAYGHIRESCQNANQLFLLTHNFVFFREFRDWFKSDNDHTDLGDEKPSAFFMLKREFDSSGRKSIIAPLDPLLKNYESDYHYLFWYVYETANSDSESNLEAYYPLPNITRRLLEMFLAFKFPNITDGINPSLAEAGVQQHTRRRIIRFVDAFSHADAIYEPGHDLPLLEQTPGILRAVLDVMKDIDPDHYRRMRRVVIRQHSRQG